jgi:hypothetical protein
MLFSTTQLSRVHHIEEHSIHLHVNGVELINKRTIRFFVAL